VSSETHDPRIIIVSNRLPVTVTVEEGRVAIERSSGGLATGLAGPHERSNTLWIGWPGDIQGMHGERRRRIHERLAELRAAPVHLTPHEVDVFYERISNGVLWPICHDRLDRLPLRIDGWYVYESANVKFADAVVEHWRPGDIIWVHDYQLLRLPALLRERLPEARIGFFLHVPFPNPEIFFTLPVRRWLVEGMMGADLVAFHTRRYRGHFSATLRRLFGLELDSDGAVEWNDRLVRTAWFPMGVDAAQFSEDASSREVTAEVHAFKPPGCRLLLGVDRLDYSKGIPRRLLAFERLLTAHPEWRGRVRLVQVAVPSRGSVGAYRQFREEVEGIVGRINGAFASPTWSPIHYLYRSVPRTTLLALYRAADVMLVTPLRDGMNLVAKEFAATRSDEDGVLLLSEFAGAADELTDALLVNPYDVDGMCTAMQTALTMAGPDRRRRMRALRARVFANDVHHWVRSFLDALGAIADPPVGSRPISGQHVP
jgi:trehalose 6-phosphate synthase/phosphatase